MFSNADQRLKFTASAVIDCAWIVSVISILKKKHIGSFLGSMIAGTNFIQNMEEIKCTELCQENN
jgi:hypothetical protein